MKSIKIDLSEKLTEIIIVPVADYHWADPQSDHKKIMEDIAYIRDTENVFCVLNGDLMDCAIASSIGDTYAATLSPMEELRVCEELFAPIAHKILCVVPGNHERRHYKTNGIDLTRLMCRQLGIEDRYSSTTAVLFIRFGELKDKDNHHRKALYTAFVSHGNGGGRKEGAKIQRLVDLSEIIDCDIYICGHSHLEGTLKIGFVRTNSANSSFSEVTHLFVNTSAKLRYSNSYGEVLGMKVPCLDTPIIWLNGSRKESRCTI